MGFTTYSIVPAGCDMIGSSERLWDQGVHTVFPKTRKNTTVDSHCASRPVKRQKMRIQVCTNACMYIQTHASTYKRMQGRTSARKYIQAHESAYKRMQVHTSACKCLQCTFHKMLFDHSPWMIVPDTSTHQRRRTRHRALRNGSTCKR